MILNCDRCGEPHGPASRFCHTCGRDFGAPTLPAPPAAHGSSATAILRFAPTGAIHIGSASGTGSTSPATLSGPTRARRTPLVAGFAIVAVVLVIGLASMLTRSGGPAVAAADLPPSGTAWFGSSFDPQTFVLAGRTSSVRLGQPIAVVGHLSRPSRDETLGFAVGLAGVQLSEPGEHVSGGHDLIGVSIPGVDIFAAGTMTVRVIDASGTTLAWGSITVSP